MFEESIYIGLIAAVIGYIHSLFSYWTGGRVSYQI